MAKCTVTLNVAKTGQAYLGQSVLVADVEGRDDGLQWTTTEGVTVPLSNAPFATIDLDRGTAYGFLLPDGSSTVRWVPDQSTANYSELEILTNSADGPTVFALEPKIYPSTNGVEPFGLEIGDYWIVLNPALPTHGDIYQKKS
jgi:hypothetical protein